MRTTKRANRLNKRGQIAIIGIILAVLVAGAATIFLTADSGDSLTGAVVGISTISGDCNITITESISNIGHDYECQSTDGFIIDVDDVILDCQDHKITCIGCDVNGSDNADLTGVRINNKTNVTIQNCRISDFTNGIKVEESASSNLLLNNKLENNTYGVNIFNGTNNNVTLNVFDNNTNCAINASYMNNNLSDETTYNRIWNNNISHTNFTSGNVGGCNDAGSYNFWYLSKACPSSSFNSTHTNAQAGTDTTNIIGGPCLGGNFWQNYTGRDNTGDGLGDTLVPYTADGINQDGDHHPLVLVCDQLPAIISETTTCGPIQLDSNSGEGYAVTKSGVTLTCNGTILNGNVSLIGINTTINNTYMDDMRGIEIKNVNDVTVKHCEIYNFTYGVYIENAYNINLINLTVHDNNQTGIFIGSLSYNVTVENSSIGHNGSNLQAFGIDIRSSKPGGSNNLITGNVIYNNTDYGIRLRDSSDTNTITSNTIYGSRDGILVNDSDGNNIYNNAIHNNTAHGIYIIDSTISDMGSSGGNALNDIYLNTEGIRLENSFVDSAGVAGNVFNNTRGVHIFDSPIAVIDLNAQNNSLEGLYINGTKDYSQVSGSFLQVDRLNLSNNTRGLRIDNSVNIEAGSIGSIHIFNNTFGITLFDANDSIFDATGIKFSLQNNTKNIVLDNSFNNSFDGLTITGGSVGVFINDSNDNTIKSNNISFFDTFNLLLNASNNNTIYDNYIDNSSGGIDANDTTATNSWNITKTAGTNIVGGDFFGGNFWSNYTGVDTDGDSIGDNPLNYTILDGNNRDDRPLTLRLAACGNLSRSVTFVQNITANGSCITVTADGITIDFNGFSITGNGSGIGINISDRSNVVVANGTITNFSTGIYVDPSTGINVSNNTITQTDIGIDFFETNVSFIDRNTLENNTLSINLTLSYHNFIYNNNVTSSATGLRLATSTNNSVYNNYFNNTNNALDDGSANKWNDSYDCTDANASIVKTQCSGGNFWSNYLGKDTGGGSAPNYNTSGDGIGDTNIPYTNVAQITGGDRLPFALLNGSATSTCQTITGDTLLEANVACTTGDGITVASDDVTLDCNGFSITGGGTGSGIAVNKRQNVIIKNCSITDFYYGIEVTSSENVQIVEQNNIELNDFYGIYLYLSNHTTIDNNTIINDNNGIYSILSENTTVTNNVINLQKKFYGIYMFESDTNKIVNNTMWNNYHGIYLVNSSKTTVESNNLSLSDVYSLFVHKSTTGSNFTHNTFTTGLEAVRIKQGSDSNNVSHNIIRDHYDYGIHSTGSDSNTFINNTIFNNTKNVYLSSSVSNSFSDNVINQSVVGIQAVSSSNSLNLTNNTINSTQTPGVEINDSSLTIITSNTIQTDARLFNSDLATINGNNSIQTTLNITSSDSFTISNNTISIVDIQSSTNSSFNLNVIDQLIALSFSLGSIFSNTVDTVNATAFFLDTVTSSSIYANTIENTTVGIYMVSSSNSNSLYNNWVKDNDIGLNISSSSSNTLYNNYFENTVNVLDDSNNKWNTSYSCGVPNIVGGPCQGGNFYSDYYGLDNGLDGREQGDGIGDQPNNYSIATGTLDTLPLVLFVARQYYHPESGLAASMSAWGNVSGELFDEEVVPNEPQTINYSLNDRYYLEITGLFNQSDVHAETLAINFTDNQTAYNISGVTGIESEGAAFVYHNGTFNSGIFFCPNVYNLSHVNSSCTDIINISSIGVHSSGLRLDLVGLYYKVSNLTNQSSAIMLNTVDACGVTILHDITLTNDISCNTTESAFIVGADNITIDFAGHTLTGNGSGIGINISSRTNIKIENANIVNYTTGVHANPSLDINISNSNITNHTTGIHFLETNNSFIDTTRILGNRIGLSLNKSSNNTIYNNFFNNTYNVNETIHSNRWNVTYNCSLGSNILGGSCIGGNFWTNYTGWDTDLDGIGDTLTPFNESHNFTDGDSLPLTSVGKIACGTEVSNVTSNVTLNQNVTGTTSCFTVVADDITFDCAGSAIVGDGSAGDVGLHLNGTNGVTIQNCIITGFVVGMNITNSTNATLLNNTFYNNTNVGVSFLGAANNTFTNSSVYNNTFGIDVLNNSDGNTLSSNTIANNSLGLNISNSVSNLVYDNTFNNTNNVWTDSVNNWNVTYNCSAQQNVLQESCLGGNFWHNYNGSDNGSGSFPYNTSGDGIGDTSVPYNNSENITTGGDSLPLVRAAICGDGLIGGAEVCDGTNFSGLTCSDYNFDTGSLACTNSCMTINTSSCSNSSSSSSSSSGGGGGGSSSSSSGGSSGGGGGGGGGSSSRKQCNDNKDNDGDGLKDFPDDPGCSSQIDVDERDPCTQSWSCGDWGECLAGTQTRNCNDVNDCANKENAGLAIMTTVPRPAESQECAGGESVPTDQPFVPGQEAPGFDPGVSADEPDAPLTLALSSLAMLFVVGGIYAYWFLYPPNRLRRKLRKIRPAVGQEAASRLKGKYLGIYNLYTKISDRHKKRFYSNVTKLREKLEDELQAEKRMQELFGRSHKGDMHKQRKTYMEIYKNYQKLPAKVQQKYYPQIVHLREELEKGRKGS